MEPSSIAVQPVKAALQVQVQTALQVQVQPALQVQAVQPSERTVCKYKLCGCYDKDSTDSRCCGFCYYFCASYDPNDSRKEVCLNDCTKHCLSQYIYTDDIFCQSTQGLTCIVCFPFKCCLFLPCLLGAGINACINDTRHTKLNYLF